MIEIINGVEMRYCPRCKEYLPVSEFYKSNKSSDGLQNYCKTCKRNVNDTWTNDNRDHYNQRRLLYAHEYYQNNPEQHHKKLFSGRLNKAVSMGKIIKPDECTLCGSTERIQGHHTSYEPGHELDVVWVCAACHASIHIQLRREEESNE